MKAIVAQLKSDSGDDEADWERMLDGGLKGEESECAFNLTG